MKTNTHVIMNVFSFSGAYYYYNPEGNKSYEATLLDVKDYSIAKQIPYRFVQKSYNLCNLNNLSLFSLICLTALKGSQFYFYLLFI